VDDNRTVTVTSGHEEDIAGANSVLVRPIRERHALGVALRVEDEGPPTHVKMTREDELVPAARVVLDRTGD